MINCDFKVFHPLGGASYVFERNFIKFISSNIKKKNVVISVGAQPNSSPHFGTLCVFSLAFSLARKLMDYNQDLKISVLFEVVDTAPNETVNINGINYQYNLKNSEKMDMAMKDFISVLDYFSKKDRIPYKVRNQNDFNSQPEIKKIISKIIKSRKKIEKLLDPKKEKLRIRVACPKCGLVDKEGNTTTISKKEIISTCPKHGKHKAIYKNESNKLEYNTPLRNLVRGMLYGTINTRKKYDYEIIRITGGEYYGFYQEELLYKVASLCDFKVDKLPMIIYCPQILDWSGAKLSKSLYVSEGAYSDLPSYLMNYKELYKTFKYKGLDIIHEETNLWLEESYRLFRNYSVYYFIKLFEKKEGERND